ncbi:MAG: RidA family protein [Gaiellaceae bacterium]
MTDRQVVRTEAAPAPYAGAPYSQAIRVGELVFVSGQLGLRPGESGLVADSIEEQTRQALENVGAILAAAGSGLGQLVKTTVFLTDLADFSAMNAVYAELVGERPPARATVQVAALPSGAKVEIEAVALVAPGA